LRPTQVGGRQRQRGEMALDIGPVGIWTSGLWQGDDAAEAAAALDELGYGALWLVSSDGGLEPHEALLAASRQLIVATGIINIWMNPPTTVAASYPASRMFAPWPHSDRIGLEPRRHDPGPGLPALPEDGQLPRRTRRPQLGGADGPAGAGRSRPEDASVGGRAPGPRLLSI
jgi:hypothetical protein